MQTYEFTLILDNASELTELMADRLYAAGCDDATPGSCDGQVTIDFHREAASLEDALRSAVRDVHTAGYEPAHIQLQPNALARPA